MESGHPGPSRRQIQIPIPTPPSVVVDVYDQDTQGDSDLPGRHRDDDDESKVPSFELDLINIDIDEPDSSSLYAHRPPLLDPDARLQRTSSSSSLLCPPSPTSIPVVTMNSDEPVGNAVDAGSPKRNPFNFQTQVISTSPVKPVRLLSYLPAIQTMLTPQ